MKPEDLQQQALIRGFADVVLPLLMPNATILTHCGVSVGRWTVDMFAMFHLGRPDVFPLGDLAVRKGLQELYQLKVDYVLHVMSCHVSLRVSAQ